MNDEIRAIIYDIETLSVTLDDMETLSVSMEIPESAGANPYEGEYEFTPSAETQVIEIEGKRATQDITINPIPSNYGLITYSGSGITVS